MCWRGDLCELSVDYETNQTKLNRLHNISEANSKTGQRIESEVRMIAAVSELPPLSPECMSVGLRAVKQFLSQQDTIDDADQAFLEESFVMKDYGIPYARRPVVWRGPDDSFVCNDVRDIRPGDTLVFPTAAGGVVSIGAHSKCRI